MDLMTRPLVVVGAGGFGRETLDVARAINRESDHVVWDIRGVVDDSPCTEDLARLERQGVEWLGPLERLSDLPAGTMVTIGVGSPEARRRLDTRITAGDMARLATLVHPSAVVGTDSHVGEGNIICAGVSIGTNVVLGRSVHLNPHAVIGHDTVLEDFVSINPNATVSGACVVELGVLVGAGAVILQGLRVGVSAVVGAAACVIRDVGTGRIVVGVPAEGLSRLGSDEVAP